MLGATRKYFVNGKKNCCPFPRCKTFQCAIFIIGFLGLAIGATGLAGYFKWGALHNLSKKTALILMAAGGGGGTMLLIGDIGSLYIKKSDSANEAKRSISQGTSNLTSSREIDAGEAKLPGLFQKIEARLAIARKIAKASQGGLLYGPDAWECGM